VFSVSRVAAIMASVVFALFAFVSNDEFARVQSVAVPSEFYASRSYYNYYGVGSNSTWSDLCLRPNSVFEYDYMAYALLTAMYMTAFFYLVVPCLAGEGTRDRAANSAKIEHGGGVIVLYLVVIFVPLLMFLVGFGTRGLPPLVVDIQSALSVTVVPAVTGALEGLHSKMRNCCS
jgi:hypothetical protein